MNKNKLKRIIKFIIIGIIIIAVLIGIYIYSIWALYTRQPDTVYLETQLDGSYSYFTDDETVNTGDFYNIMTYNIGFGAYTSDYSFFMDGGKSSWAKSEDALMANVSEISDVINFAGVDFILLQEVDIDGTRSYHVNEIELLNKYLKGYYYTEAINYDSMFLLYPVWQPHGRNKSAIATYSKAPIAESVRKSLPVSDDFSKLFDLDRCYTVSKIPTANEKMLCLYNVHLSAYGDDPAMKQAQLDKLLNDMAMEYKAGNYVVCGGDFNMDMRADHVDNEYSWGQPFPRDQLPKGFSLGIDVTKDDNIEHDSCRNANEPYNPETTFTITTDGFIVSDNIKVNYYNHANWEYAYSDHDPVIIQIILKE